MKKKFKRFDAADYLDDEQTIAEYLTAALEVSRREMEVAAASPTPTTSPTPCRAAAS